MSKKPEINPLNCDLQQLISNLELNTVDDPESFIFEDIVENNDLTEMDGFSEGSLCEIIRNEHVCVGKIVKNISGRLLIDLYGLGQKEWIFYLDPRFKPFGWAKTINFKYKNLENLSSNDLERLNSEISARKPVEMGLSSFRIGQLMECLYENKFYVAKVIECVNNDYFKIKINSKNPKINDIILTFCLNKNLNFHQLFPCKWCSSNNLVLEPTFEWLSDEQFDWDVFMRVDGRGDFYLTETQSVFNWARNLTQLSEKFKLGMYLECVLPNSAHGDENETNGLICLGQIKAKLNHLLFIKIFNGNKDKLYIFTIDSMELFPVNWCHLNNYSKFEMSFLKENLNFYQFEIRKDFSQIPYLSEYKSNFLLFSVK